MVGLKLRPLCALMQSRIFNYCLSPPRGLCSPKLSLFPGALGIKDGQDKDCCVHSADEEADPREAECAKKAGA